MHTNHPLWPPSLNLLCLSFGWYWLLSGSPWLHPAVPLMIGHGWRVWMFAMPVLSHTGYSITLSSTDKAIVGILSAPAASDKFHLLAPPTLIFYSKKWNSGLIIFWINGAASQLVSLRYFPLLSFSAVSVSLVFLKRIYQKICPCTLHVSANQIMVWQSHTEAVIHGSLLQGMIILYNHSDGWHGLLTNTTPSGWGYLAPEQVMLQTAI